MTPNTIAVFIQTFIGIVTIVIAAVVGTAKAREIAHAKYIETINDLKAISDAKQEFIEVRDTKIHELEGRAFDLNTRLSHLEGFNRRLIEDQYSNEEYIRVLRDLLLRNKITVPPKGN